MPSSRVCGDHDCATKSNIRDMKTNADRRAFGRRTTLLRGKVILPGRGRIYCMIHNLSEGGALLEFEDGRISMPHRFELEIEIFGTRLMCEPRHASDAGVGVRFVSGDVAPILKRIDRVREKQIRSENDPVRPEDLVEPPLRPSAGAAVAKPETPRFDALSYRRARLTAAE